MPALSTAAAIGYLRRVVPKPATSAPPAVADAGAQGNVTRYAMENHTHASKARRDRKQSDAAGLITWVFDPPFDVGVVPRINAIAETATGITDVVNVQVEGVPTNAQCQLRVTRTKRSFLSLLGLDVLSVPAGGPGATWVHMAAVSP